MVDLATKQAEEERDEPKASSHGDKKPKAAKAARRAERP
jgi:hypothetical protein